MQNKEIEKVKYRLKFHLLYAGMPNDCCIVNQNDVKELLQYIEQLENEIKELIQQLKIEYKQLTQSVKRYEEMRRKCKDEFYKKSYQTQIHKLNAKRETILADRERLQKMLKKSDANNIELQKEIETLKDDIYKYDSLVEKIKKTDIELANMKVEGEAFKTAVNFARKNLQELLDTEK